MSRPAVLMVAALSCALGVVLTLGVLTFGWADMAKLLSLIVAAMAVLWWLDKPESR